MDEDGNSFEYNTIMNFADDLEQIGVYLLSTDNLRQYAAAAEAYTQATIANLDGKNTIEDLNL